ncbi:MAG: hypothetical protein LBL78_00870 [Prevotellaceae bacterium]|jgi:hypothetical protein|nr:hypothetical protein [Prevotellaceae bacterium]
MASRRELKKYVNYISGELFLEGFIRCWKMPEGEKKRADEFLGEVMMLQSEFISRISHTETGNVKAYYRKFHEDFRARVTELEQKLKAWA